MSFMRGMSSGVMFCIAPAIWSTYLLHQLLAQLVDQLLEALRGLGRLEVVALQLAHLAGEVGRAAGRAACCAPRPRPRA